MTNSKTIDIPILTRVEGEAALTLDISNNSISKLQLRIFEPPRFFESLLKGRDTQELIDIISRICGLCPVAYQLTAVQAIESIIGLSPTAWVSDMRRLFCCGEWIQNHSLHIHMLSMPDVLGFDSMIAMSKKFPDEVRRGLRLQTIGNRIIELLGGRSVHPVSVVVSGFTHSPDEDKVKLLLEECHRGLEECYSLMEWIGGLSLPAFIHDFTSVSLANGKTYPMLNGDIVSDNGLTIQANQYEHYFKEEQVEYSNALHCLLNGKSYLVGPLARMNNNFQLLPKELIELVSRYGYTFPSKNMFDSMMARAMELTYSMSLAISILSNYTMNDQPCTHVASSPGIGYGCTEAPRGVLWQKYEINSDGLIGAARIVPPTSQNQARIEQDIRESLLSMGLNKGDDELIKMSEMIIRNYDPCISCSTHFLDMRIQRH